MSPQSNSTPIPWYWNIACASIAGSTAEVIYIFSFISNCSFSYSPFLSIQLKYVFKFKVNKKLYKGMPIKQNTMECSTH